MSQSQHFLLRLFPSLSDDVVYERQIQVQVHFLFDCQFQHLYKDRIIKVLDNHSSSNSTNPFFLYISFQTPHTPHAVPEEYEDLYPDIDLPLYKTYYAMISAMDEAIGEMTSSLKNLGLYDNTVIVFIGDNGAPKAMVNSNSPLNGYKGTEFEGGTRTAAFIHSPLIPYEG